jgi:hypothetical protein
MPSGARLPALSCDNRNRLPQIGSSVKRKALPQDVLHQGVDFGEFWTEEM